MSNEFDKNFLENILPIYYKRFFPYKLLYRWLSYGNPITFAKREICFILFGNIYCRYQSFDNQSDFLKALQTKCPVQINLGAVYKTKPKNKESVPKIIPFEKEIIFDIDMSDYDEVRICCSKANVCKKCWKFMTIACRILDAALKEDFGYKHNLWVFSGRRGIHCWVCDEKARKQDEDVRCCVASYLEVVKGGILTAKKVCLPGIIHESLKRAVIIIDKYFLSIVKEHDILGTEERLKKFLQMIDKDLRPTCESAMKLGKTSLERWNIFEEIFNERLAKDNLPQNSKNLKEEIKLQYAYPRLDIKVTQGLNHLLKSPFSVHPSTGKISVPFDPENVDTFDPTRVPTVLSLIDEIDTRAREQKNGAAYNENGSLSESIGVFETFLEAVKSEITSRPQEISMEF